MTRFRYVLAIYAAAAVAGLLAWYWPHVRNEVFVLMGNRAEGAGYYGWWSGIGGATQNFTLAGAAFLLYRHKNCHVHRCWRVGRFQAGQYLVCRRHLPGGAPSAGDVTEAHRRHP